MNQDNENVSARIWQRRNEQFADRSAIPLRKNQVNAAAHELSDAFPSNSDVHEKCSPAKSIFWQ